MKKLFPLLVIAAGAVAYSVYKNHKESLNSEDNKTLVSLDDDSTQNSVVSEPEEIVAEPVEKKDPVEEAVQEVQEELGIFETLRDTDEPYERPSFFHMTEDSYLEPETLAPSEEPSEIITIIVEDDEDAEISEEEPELETQETVEETEEQVFEEVHEMVEIEESSNECEEESVISDEPSEVVSFFVDEAVEDETVEIEQENEESVYEEVRECAEEWTEPADGSDFEQGSLEEAVETEENHNNESFNEQEAEIEELSEVFEEAVEQLHEDAVFIENEADDLIEEIASQIEEASNASEPEQPEIEEPELEPLQSYNTPEVDELMKEIAGQVKAADKTAAEEPEEVNEEEPEAEIEEETDYLQDIRKITELYSEKVAQYNIRYPYLSSRFIDDTLKFSHQFNAEYPMGTRVAIEHHAHFSAIEDLFVFAQIIRQSGYSVREGAEDKSLIVVREMFVDNNTILHDVFKVANQVYCLSGEYQKFRISKR